jgi:conjugal transfer pilus assembly protein TraW
VRGGAHLSGAFLAAALRLSPFVVLLPSPPAVALDLGVIGPAYAIAEPDLLVELQAKLAEVARTGELQALQRAARQRIVAAIETPPPVAGLARSEHARTFYFDPSVVVGEPIVDAQGRVLVAAGTRTNPLDVVSLSQPLLFFDGRDAAQVRHAKALIERYGGKVKPILTGGSYLHLMRRWRSAIYYDQQGALVQKLGIREVPAVVSQEGKRLRIDVLAATP